MDIIKQIAIDLGVKATQVDAAVKLLDEGNTVPFISRYRKEVTGGLDDEQLRTLSERLTYLRNLEEKKNTCLASIEEQGLLTEELKKAILEATTQVAVDDLYRPYRPKRRTRATIAKEKGLEPLANTILLQMTNKSLEEEAKAFLNEEKDVKTVEEAIAGACDIIAETIADDADYRTWIREITTKKGSIVSRAKDKEQESVYENYYEYDEAISKLPGHRILAINRGEKEKVLKVEIAAPVDDIHNYLQKKVITRDNPNTKPALIATIEDAYARLIAPSIENEIRGNLTEMAEDGAIKVFGKNLFQLLMAPPIAGHTVLGWDPGYRNGCKIAVVDATGKVLDTTIVYPTPPRNNVEGTKKEITAMIKKHGVTLISLGNGTASRESEQIIVDMLKDIPTKVEYVIVNEAGASVYSASKLAADEFPDYDVNVPITIYREYQEKIYDRVGIDTKTTDLLGVKVPYLEIPAIIKETLDEIKLANNVLGEKTYAEIWEYEDILKYTKGCGTTYDWRR